MTKPVGQEYDDQMDDDGDEDDDDEDDDDDDDDEEESDEEDAEEEEEDPLNMSSSMLGGDSEISAMSEENSLPSSISITPVSSLSKKHSGVQKKGT